MKEKICVFASSSDKIGEEYFVAAKELGKLIAQNGYDFVYGAGCVGTMFASASSAKFHGAKVYGVIPEKLNNIGVDWKECDEIFVTECMASRKKKMRELADSFIAIPGGFGTFDEIFEVITLKQLGYHAKPIVFLNTNNYYSEMFKQFGTMFEQNFARKVNEELYYIAQTPQEAVNYIKNYVKTEPVSKWDK